MATKIAKNLTVTRVSYCTVDIQSGDPAFVSHPDAVFRGIVPKERVKKLLAARFDTDETIVIKSIQSGTFRYEMDLETFVLNANIVSPEDATDTEQAHVLDGDSGEGPLADTPDVLP